MEFRELSDGEWGLIKFLLPPRFRGRKPTVDDRSLINGILCGCPGGMPSNKYGSYVTDWKMLRKLNRIPSDSRDSGSAIDSTAMEAKRG